MKEFKELQQEFPGPMFYFSKVQGSLQELIQGGFYLLNFPRTGVLGKGGGHSL